MEQSPEFKAQVRLLAEAGRELADRGWLPARTGHFSARLDDRHIVITAPGRSKDLLDAHDFMVVDLEGHRVTGSGEPGPETFLHIIMYRRDAQLGAVLHTHSVQGTVLSRQVTGSLLLRDYEALRELPGCEHPARGIRIPVFANEPDMQQLAARVDAAMDRDPALAGYLIGGHGLYTWGETVERAMQRTEAFEFMFECETLARQLPL
ncbi:MULTISPECIES: methylthioribulose 1-phosphate dehydratase [unclassified Thioalkalivibrio]|uniref:methylthioribulose 1-phosphate dehydratase n=1 Tax=unclassified Thioalkalivibrio TaxID=2621013 RepID=UPI00037B1B92|nr:MULTISPECIES: methylthioribulose 1-phosphate dehydratase [unclassified Thioalkalivibrio]